LTLANKTILITGASSGIGRATSIRLAQVGAKLVLVGRRENALVELIGELEGEGHKLFCADLTNESDITGLARNLNEKNIAIDGVVNAAGIHQLRPIKQVSSSSLLSMFKTNTVSAVLLFKALLKSKLLSKKGASVIFISSAAAVKGEAATVDYAASKGALISITRSIAVEMAKSNIRINSIAPGVVDTPMSRAFLKQLPVEQANFILASHPMGIGTTDDIALPIMFLLSDDAKWITGQTICIDGGLTI
jgi:NAD(P)-dependent dehydrogenase (short-subunit alcohol dehydrogenase family)